MNRCEKLYDYILKSEDILGEIDKVAKSERITDDMYIYYIYNVITRHISINDFNGISTRILLCVCHTVLSSEYWNDTKTVTEFEHGIFWFLMESKAGL